jgi:tetratricopeptide (TPR) repeat protein
MKCFSFILIVCASLAISGCKPKAKDITPLQRKEAASLVSEAQFALTLRDLARAEPLFEKATKLCPDTGEYWLGLGATRKRMGNKSGAKSAYENAREAFHDVYAVDPQKTEALMQEIHALALLGKTDDARATLAKARKKDPTNVQLKGIEESKAIDDLLVDPGFKELAL